MSVGDGGFQGSEHAALYIKYRASPDGKVISKIVDYVEKQKSSQSSSLRIAIDVGCGSGQSTRLLAPYFDKVIGVDVSEAQIAEAKKATTANNVEYRVGTAENLPIEDCSVDLVTCSQAAHWLDFPAFCDRADKALKPSGCMAVFTTGSFRIKHEDQDVAEKLTQLFNNLYYETFKPYWTHGIDYEDIYMHQLAIPYSNFERHRIPSENKWTVANFAGYITSLSAYQNYHRENPNPDDILGAFQRKFLKLLQVETSAENTVMHTSAPTYLLLASKPSRS